jgi:hypothetical protein
MKLVFLVMTVTMIGCGQGFLGKDESGSDSSSETAAEEDKSGKLQSLALDSKDDLPDCTESNETQLSYVKDESQFYVCESEEWAEISVTDEVEPLEANEWRDPVTDYVWLIGSKVSYSFISTACEGDYDTGTADEVKAAAAHGLSTDDGIWVNSSTNKYMNGGTLTTESGSTKHNAVCVKK